MSKPAIGAGTGTRLGDGDGPARGQWNLRAVQIQFITGDATDPNGAGNKIIAHVCNDIGAWGAGFVLAISKRWPQPEAEYLKSQGRLTLGTVSLIQVESGIWVANMIAQRGIRTEDGVPPIRSRSGSAWGYWLSKRGNCGRPFTCRESVVGVPWGIATTAWSGLQGDIPAVAFGSGGMIPGPIGKVFSISGHGYDIYRSRVRK